MLSALPAVAEPPPSGDRRLWRGSAAPANRNRSGHGSSLRPGLHRRSAGADLGVAPAFDIGVDLLNGRKLHSQRTPGGHSLGRPAGADRLNKQLLGVARAIGFERHDQVGRDRGTLNVFPMTAGAVEVELLPPVVDLLRDGVSRRLMVLIPKLLGPKLRGKSTERDDDAEDDVASSHAGDSVLSEGAGRYCFEARVESDDGAEVLG